MKHPTNTAMKNAQRKKLRMRAFQLAWRQDSSMAGRPVGIPSHWGGTVGRQCRSQMNNASTSYLLQCYNKSSVLSIQTGYDVRKECSGEACSGNCTSDNFTFACMLQ